MTKIIVGIASIPSRQSSLKTVINCLLPQCDEIHVYLNQYTQVPDFLNHDKIKHYIESDMGDVGKFYNISNASGYYFAVDDDIIYPVDYTKKMIHNIEHYKRKSVVGVHGCILNLKSMNNYYKDRNLTHYRTKLEQNRTVHVVGTGTVAFHTDTLMVRLSDFPKPNMADIWFAILAQKQRVPINLISRPLLWLKDCPEAASTGSIYSKSKDQKHGEYQTEVVRKYKEWKLFNA